MTDRELPFPVDPQRPQPRPRIAPLTHGQNIDAHQESAPRGDGPPMAVTTASRTCLRTSPADTPPVEPLRALLARLFTACHELPAFVPALLPPALAGERPPAEALAAARALACPDLFVVHAPDAFAGERVIAEVARGHGCSPEAGRVLVLSPNPVAADRITERLVRVAGPVTVRALADDENPVRPSPVVSRVTSATLGIGSLEQSKRATADAIATAESRLAALDQLAALSPRLCALDESIAEFAARGQQIEIATRADRSLTARVAQLTAEAESTVARLTADWQAACAEQKKQEAEVDACRKQLADATRKPGFFSRLFGGAKPAADTASAETFLHQIERQAGESATRACGLQKELDAATTALAGQREEAIREEIAIRKPEVDSQLAQLHAAQQQLRAEMDAATRALGANPANDGELESLRATLAGELAAARERAAELNGNRADLVRRFLAEARVVVGTPGCLGVDPALDHGHREPTSAPPFALLILDRAEELAEVDFVQLAKLAVRWVLVGDVSPQPEPRPVTNGVHPRQGRNGRHVDIPFAGRLAQALDRERWVHEGERLVCRLAHPTADERRGMTREPLLDHPEIELRFFTDSAGELMLAEVVFLAGTTPAMAKEFLFHQLGEVLLHPCGEVCWDHTPTQLVASWPDAEPAAPALTVWVELEPGVREKVVGFAAIMFTTAVSFDPAAGWDAAKAEAWLALHLPTASPTRLAVLPRTNPVPRAVLAR